MFDLIYKLNAEDDVFFFYFLNYLRKGDTEMLRTKVLTDVVEKAPTFVEKANTWVSDNPFLVIVIGVAAVAVAGFAVYKKFFKK